MRLFSVVIACLLLSFGLYAQTAKKSIHTVAGKAVKVKDLNLFIQRTLDSLEIAGASIAIINDGRMVYSNVFGVKDVISKEPVTTATIFEAASLSKPVFAYFFMRMVDMGMVSLDEPMYKLLPHPDIKDADERYKLITPRMVLSHSTGFPNWSGGKPIEMVFTPGNGFSYSGEAHQYLSAWLATACKTNWQKGLDSVFQENVAEPLGMNHTFFVGNDYFTMYKATGYEKQKAKDIWLPKTFGAAHTLHSEAVDYSKFLEAMISGKGLSKGSYEEILKEQNHFKDDNELLKVGQTGWSLGFAMKPTPNGVRYLHTGNNTGFRAYACFYREKKYGFVLFVNSDKINEFYGRVGKYLDDEF